ncbi:MAG: HlyD family efflux transporter periplasmic adaptor subunit [Leptothrix sp. (in: Bacteria)]|jgi:cobalt-zinc-cadmium efflux system membrane fusion protein|nr:HlyD family efflux transporter periplasmic adaptor subunit [Leptothrix sp. (in: b-proteobacteria)]
MTCNPSSHRLGPPSRGRVRLLPLWLAIPAAALFTLPVAAWAHGGEDHSHAEPQAMAPTAATTAATTVTTPAATPGLPATAAATATGSAGPTGTVERPQRLPDGRIFLPKASQRRLELRTATAQAGSWPRSRELLGQVVADPQSGGRVQAAQAGRIAPAPAGAQGLPMPGQRVQRGQVLALLLPLQSSAEAAGRQAELAELAVKADLAARQLERARALSATVPRREIESLEAEHASLRARQTALAAGQKAEALQAPVSGVLVGAPVLAGQVVEAREALFEIADPQRLLVEALLPDPTQAQGLRAAALAEGGAALLLVGRAGALRDGGLPLWFRPAPPSKGQVTPALVLNQPVRVLIQLAESLQGVALPAGALQRNAANEPVVWLHERAEIFRPQVVQVQPLDGRQVLVKGLTGGERVVTQGAALLQQIR